MAIRHLKWGKRPNNMDGTGNHTTVGSNNIFSGISRSNSPSYSIADTTLGDPADNPSDIRPNIPSDTPLSPRTATMTLKSNAKLTPMTNEGSTSAATRRGRLQLYLQDSTSDAFPDSDVDEDVDDELGPSKSAPTTKESTSAATPSARRELLKDGKGADDVEDDELELSDKEVAHAAEVRFCSGGKLIAMSEAIYRATVLIPRDIALQRATIQKIRHFFAKSDTARTFVLFSRSEILRFVTEKVRKVHFQYTVTGDNTTDMPPKAQFLAIRFCHPHETAPMPEELGGYLQAMNRADLTQVEGVEKPEVTLLSALIGHIDGMHDIKKRIVALEKSAQPKEIDYLTKKSEVMESAIKDFRLSVKGALDRRPSRFELDEAMAKSDKKFNDLAEKYTMLESRLQESLGSQALVRRNVNSGQAPKRPSDDAHHSDENQVKKRRLEDTVEKMDFSDIV